MVSEALPALVGAPEVELGSEHQMGVLSSPGKTVPCCRSFVDVSRGSHTGVNGGGGPSLRLEISIKFGGEGFCWESVLENFT